MSVNLSLLAGAGWQFFDNNGAVLNGGFLYTYAAGTTTPLTTFTTVLGNVENDNPIELDSAGRLPNEIWLTEGLSYKFMLADATDTPIPGCTWDNINGTYIASDLINSSNAAKGAALVGFSQDLSYPQATIGGHANHRVYVTDAPWNIVADGDGAGGGTEASVAIQEVIDYFMMFGFPCEIVIPSVGTETGIYRCDFPLSYDASVIKPVTDGAMLDFTNLDDAETAITVTGGTLDYAGNPFFNTYNCLQGFKIWGGTPYGTGNTKVGVRYYGATGSESPAHSGMRDTLIWGFQTGLLIDDNSYILSFDHIEIFLCGTCVSEPVATNAGERIVFSNSAFYNSSNGFALYNSTASTFINGCSIDGMDAIYFYILCGNLSVSNSHIEGNFAGDNPTARMFWNDDVSFPSYSYVTWSGNTVLVKDAGSPARANPVFDFNGAINFTATGGYIYANEGATVAAAVFAGTGAGTVYVNGTFVDYGASTLNDITGPYYSFDLANNLDAVRNYGSVNAPSIAATDGSVESYQGIFGNNNNTVTLVLLSTLYSLGIGNSSGLLVCRDGDLGGMAVFACDPSAGVTTIHNGITGLACSYSGGQLSLQVTSGAADRNVRWSILRTQNV